MPASPTGRLLDGVKFPRRLVATVVVVGLAAAGFVYATRSNPPQVLVHTVPRGTVEATVANTRAGTVNARQRAKLAASLVKPVPGK